MGGSDSKLSVQEINKSNISTTKSPPKKKSKEAISPNKSQSPPPRAKNTQSAAGQALTKKSSESVLMESSRGEDSFDGKSKKKIKSVKKLPASLDRDQRETKQVIDEVEQLNNSSGKYDRKAKNQKMEMHKLIRIYDLG